MDNTKVLTEAQREHLRRLNQMVMQAQAQVDSFVVYLRVEHDATVNEWEIRSLQVGFERVTRKGGSGDKN